jgi:hypothetical protein
MTTKYDQVLEETKRFRAALPELKKTLLNRWVVFLDNQVQADCSTEGEAYDLAVRKFGANGGFVLALVADTESQAITASVLFGFR